MTNFKNLIPGCNAQYTCAGGTTKILRCIHCNSTKEYTILADGTGSWVGSLNCDYCKQPLHKEQFKAKKTVKLSAQTMKDFLR